MTVKARIVLQDCKAAFKELTQTIHGKPGRLGREEFAKTLPEINSEEQKKIRRLRWV